MTFMNKAVAFCIRSTVPATNLPAPTGDLGRLSESLGSPGEGKTPEGPQEGAQEEQEGRPESVTPLARYDLRISLRVGQGRFDDDCSGSFARSTVLPIVHESSS